MIGKGGFGRVFHGKLRYSDVAVKVLNTVSEIHMISNNSMHVPILCSGACSQL